MVGISEALNHDEQVVAAIRCDYIDDVGRSKGGELVLTQRGLVFLEKTGIFGTGRRRHHSCDYQSMRAVRIEVPGLIGAHLCIDYESPIGRETMRYKLSLAEALYIKAVIRKAVEAIPQPSEILEFAEPTMIRETVVTEVTLIVCPHCGHRNDSDRGLCEICATSI
jgi:hypothetical protein